MVKRYSISQGYYGFNVWSVTPSGKLGKVIKKGKNYRKLQSQYSKKGETTLDF